MNIACEHDKLKLRNKKKRINLKIPACHQEFDERKFKNENL